MSDKTPWTVTHKDCYLGDTFEVSGGPFVYQEVCSSQDGSVLFTVRKDEYQDGTLFDVVLHVTPK